MTRFKTTRADGSVHEHELQWVSHLKHEHGDTIEDTWGLLPTVKIDKNVEPGRVAFILTSEPDDRITP